MFITFYKFYATEFIMQMEQQPIQLQIKEIFIAKALTEKLSTVILR